MVPYCLWGAIGGQWIVRGSLASLVDYNIFYSDVDLALVVGAKETKENINKRISKYVLMKRWLIFLGELEVYTETEWNARVALETKHKDLVFFIRNFRKEKWLKNAIESHSSGYHYNKAQRALKKLDVDFDKMVSQLKQFLSEKKLDYLGKISPDFNTYIAFYDQILASKMPKELANFFALVAVNYLSDLNGESPLAFEKSIIERHEMLCYRGYLRFIKQDMDATNDWLDRLLNNRVHLEHNQWVTCHLNEREAGAELDEMCLQMERKLTRATTIKVSHPYFALWVKAIHPCNSIKLEFDFNLHFSALSLLSRGDQKSSFMPAANTVSFVTPFSVRFGAARINQILKGLEGLTKERFTLEITSNVELTTSEYRELLEYSSSSNALITVVDCPTGVIIMPTLYNFLEDIDWVKNAEKFRLPVVAGYCFEFEKKILQAFQTRESYINLDFDYLKAENIRIY